MKTQSKHYNDFYNISYAYAILLFCRNISKSLVQIRGEVEVGSPRYVTRSTTKLSKSMNDLLQL